MRRKPTKETFLIQKNMAQIPFGKPHHTLCDLEILIYDYDAMGVKSKVLPAGSLFQPWEPLDHWRGSRIPITLGDGATAFDWGVTSYEGHFLKWEDFRHCRLSEPEANDSAPF